MGTEDLALHYYAIGDYQSAFKHLTRMREYCTTAKHIAEMQLKVALVCVAQEQWMQLQSAAHRVQSAFSSGAGGSSTGALLAKGAPQQGTQPVDEAQANQRFGYEVAIPALLGLAAMNMGDYRSAASHFIKTSPGFICYPLRLGMRCLQPPRADG